MVFQDYPCIHNITFHIFVLSPIKMMNIDLIVDVQKKSQTVVLECTSCCKAINYGNHQDDMMHQNSIDHRPSLHRSYNYSLKSANHKSIIKLWEEDNAKQIYLVLKVSYPRTINLSVRYSNDRCAQLKTVGPLD